MQENIFKWWYALIGYVSYLVALGLTSVFMPLFDGWAEGAGFSSGNLFNVLLFVFAGGICLLLLRLVSKGKLSREAFGLHLNPLLKPVLIGSALGVLFFVVSEVVEANNETLRKAGEQVIREFNLGENLVNDLWLVLGVGLFAPVVEEIVFRGAIFQPILKGLRQYRAIPKGLPLLIALAVSAYAFVSAHGGGGQDAQLGLLALLGVLAALGMYFSKSLVGAIFVHAVNNNLVFIYTIWKQPELDQGYMLFLTAASIVCLLLCLPLGLLYGRILPGRA